MFLKSCLKDSLCALSLTARKLRGQKTGVPILMYHSIDRNDVFFTVRPAAFAKQMRYLRDNHYRIVSLPDLVDMLSTQTPLPDRAVVLTFDDGYADNYQHAWPILKKCGFPATIFLLPRLAGSRLENSQGSALPLMNWPQIKEMHQSGLIDFEPHGLTHFKLIHCSPRQVEREMGESRRMIETILSKKCALFSYPKGRYNQGVIALLKQQRFKGAVTVIKGRVHSGDNLYTLKRCSVNSTVSFVQFRAYLTF